LRVIAATNRDLQKAVDQREFRLDLYHRLKVVELDIPPLRRRAEDIPLLIEHFISELTQDNKSRLEGFSAAALDLLQNYAWPGNVRELRNLIEYLVFLAPRALVEPEDFLPHLGIQPTRHLPVPTNKTPDQSERELIYFALLDLKREVAELRAAVERDASVMPSSTPPVAPRAVQPVGPEEPIYPVEDTPYHPADSQESAAIRIPENAAIEPLPTLKDREREAIEQALNRVGGNRRKAAAILGISTRTLYRKLKEYDLE
ncbi:MAG: sigma-54-dependent Fis family transcriptional regulator, partial [Candidatus Latescibacteria bacterium]|nr:sigma-54-dependent Fis family transcriptional regulator [Candidatus Latescibacterota bacterium]